MIKQDIYSHGFPTPCDKCERSIFKGQPIFYDMDKKLKLCKKCAKSSSS